MQRLEATVRGRVQGVGFRYFVVRAATPLAISGYARNMMDGGVEVVAEGEKEELEELIESLKEGPSFSRVSGVELEWKNIDTNEFRDFTIKY